MRDTAHRRIAAVLRLERKTNTYKVALVRALGDLALAFPDLGGDGARPRDVAYFTIGETTTGRACSLNETFRDIVEAEGLLVRETKASHGLDKLYVGFDLGTCSEAALERVLTHAFQAIRACDPDGSRARR